MGLHLVAMPGDIKVIQPKDHSMKVHNPARWAMPPPPCSAILPRNTLAGLALVGDVATPGDAVQYGVYSNSYLYSKSPFLIPNLASSHVTQGMHQDPQGQVWK